jgi:hypothetical protein
MPHNNDIYIRHEVRILSVCPFEKYTFLPLDGVFTPKLLLTYRSVGQQQRALMVYSENIQLWHQFLAKGDTSDICNMLMGVIWHGDFNSGVA